eukprot:TRINITY_DN982_c0_g1_i1.p1 TRINITY_DN982_c0_g1~~TRINITY_DN982_c0_g1_i1.p1  ORF type:complete len:140 (+),score=3.74 TRINITY_DN982_c0_g1_i1:42-422(+)
MGMAQCDFGSYGDDCSCAGPLQEGLLTRIKNNGGPDLNATCASGVWTLDGDLLVGANAGIYLRAFSVLSSPPTPVPVLTLQTLLGISRPILFLSMELSLQRLAPICTLTWTVAVVTKARSSLAVVW